MNRVDLVAATPSSDIEELMMVEGEVNHAPTDWLAIEQIADAIDKMEQPYKALIRMVFYDKYTYNQITEIMGYSSKSVTWYNVQKGIRILKESIINLPNIKERYVDGE